MKKFFTSESVTEGHPDKLCDSISDAILDACLRDDPFSRVAAETFASKDSITIAGEITTNAQLNYEEIARNKIKEIGYEDALTGLDYRTCKIDVNITKQSNDIWQGVETGGAGDQGIIFGYACDETKEYMPYAIITAHRLAKRLTYVRKQNIIPYLMPDGKTQVTVEYDEDKIKRIDAIVVSCQHKDGIDLEQIRNDVKKYVIDEVIDSKLIDENTKIFINPTGRFVIGGPLGDVGLTGRKIVVDTYGGYGKIGGGAFSGKDPSKVDRSAAYMLRYIAKNIVANGLAKKCEIQLSYAIGVAQPVSIFVDTFGTGILSDEKIVQIIENNFDLTPNGIIKELDLRKPIYEKTTNYGHFGKENLAWEKIKKLNIN